jgi:hypothetical protein
MGRLLLLDSRSVTGIENCLCRRDGIVSGHDLTRYAAHCLQATTVLDGLVQSSSGAVDVQRIKYPAVYAFVNQLGPAPIVLGAQDRQATRHGFGHHQTPVVFESWDDECVGRCVIEGKSVILDATGKAHIAQAVVGTLVHVLLHVWAVANQE